MNRLREIRQDLGLTQDELAVIAGCSSSSVRRQERAIAKSGRFKAFFEMLHRNYEDARERIKERIGKGEDAFKVLVEECGP